MKSTLNRLLINRDKIHSELLNGEAKEFNLIGGMNNLIKIHVFEKHPPLKIYFKYPDSGYKA